MSQTIFRAGTHRTVNGRVIAFSEEDLAATVAAYDPAVHEAPVVVGHPKTDDPALGWVSGLKCVGLRLEADFRQLDPAFAEAVEAGRYKHVSAAFYAPDSPNNPKPGVYYLRHVGALGAVPPSVKGLGPLTFAEDDTVFIAFGEDDPADNPNEEPMDTKNDTASALASAKEAENAELRRQLDEMKARMEKQETDRRHADNVSFAEGLVASGRLAAAHRDMVAATLDALGTPKEDGTLIAFGEGGEEGPLAERFRTFLSSAEPQVMFAEFAVDGTSTPKESPLVADAKRRAERAKRR